MAFAKENRGRGRANKIARVAFARLAAGARSNPKKGKLSMPRKHNYGYDDSAIAAVVASTIRDFNASKSLPPGERGEFDRGDADAWWGHITSGSAAASTPAEKALRGKLKREAMKQLKFKGGWGKKGSRVGGKASKYRVGGKYEMYTIPGGFAAGKQGKRTRVPRKPKGVRARDWYEQIGGKSGYKDLYGASKFSQYNQHRVDWRNDAPGFDPEMAPVPWAERKTKGGRVRKARTNPKFGSMPAPHRGDWRDPAAGVSTWAGPGPYKASGAVLAGAMPYQSKGYGGPWREPGTSYTRKPRTGGGGNKAALDAYKSLKAQATAMGWKKGLTPDAKAKTLQAFIASKSNPFVGDLALTNPGFGGVAQYFTGYAVPVAVAGGAAGAVHALASSQGWTEMLAENVGKIPVVGEFVEDNLPYTLQGLLVGTGLAVLAPMVGGAAGKYLALTGGAALVFGGGIDAFNYMIGTEEGGGEEDLLSELEEIPDEDVTGALAFGDLALENVSALGDLALENVSALGDLALENQSFTSLLAPSPLAGGELSEMYGQASYADAYYSGADLSGEEGTALLNGARAWRARFPITVRMAGRSAGGPSHLAGRAGHRWGWMIRALGDERARQIASLPPAKRLRVLQKLRQAAIATYEQLMLEAQAVQAETTSADPELVPAAGSPANGANGVNGANGAGDLGMFGYLGDPALFMGA